MRDIFTYAFGKISLRVRGKSIFRSPAAYILQVRKHLLPITITRWKFSFNILSPKRNKIIQRFLIRTRKIHSSFKMIFWRSRVPEVFVRHQLNVIFTNPRQPNFLNRPFEVRLRLSQFEYDSFIWINSA
ncbi:hypothetical protein NL30_29095 [Burkholderia contaminans]|nr:hypothetical protein NL30_29095 [Burkholderia contaminans]